MQQTLTFTIPVPPSTKNSRRILKHGRRRIVAKSKAAMSAMRSIQDLAIQELHRRALRPPPFNPLFGDDDVAVDITHNVEADTVTISVWSAGPRGKGKTGRKRDLQNLQEGILDALQGILFENDNQVTELRMRRAP